MPDKKEREKKKGGGQALLNQMGIMPDMSAMDAMIYGDLDDDEDLEAELLALQGEESPDRQPSPKKAGMAAVHQLDNMLAECLRDVSDEDVSDTEDPDLLHELEELDSDDSVKEPPAKTVARVEPEKPPTSMVSIVTERLDMYTQAHANAKSTGDSSKARRLDRGIRTLQDLLKKAKTGRAVAEDDLPPPVALTASVKPKPSPPEQTAPMPVFSPTVEVFQPTAQVHENTPIINQEPCPPASELVTHPERKTTPEHLTSPDSASASAPMSHEDAEKCSLLITRKDQYRTAALEAKRSGNESTARKYIKISKQFEAVITALKEGRPIDLSQMPPPPGEAQADRVSSIAPPAAAPREREAAQGTANPTPMEENIPEITDDDKKNLFKAPEAAVTVLDALEQRLAKYEASANSAKDESNTSKARRMGRIVKQYEDAVKAYKAGRHVDYEELPCPPGFPPIPLARMPTPAGSPVKAPAPAPPTHAFGPSQHTAGPAQPNQTAGGPVPRKAPSKVMQRQMSATSRAEKQSIFLQERQLQFRKAALVAKKRGEMELAKKYLRMAKGFDQMIEASQSGLPVDMSQVPPAPGTSRVENLEFMPIDENSEQPIGDREEAYKRLQQDLISQIQTATSNADHFAKMGDVGTASNFDRMSQNSRRDLAAVKNAFKHGDPVPRFHYETRSFTLVQSCSDLGDNDLELVIVRGINYGLPSGYAPKDLDTYVKFEFPHPNNDPQKGDTDTCKHTNTPEYNQSFKLEVNRSSRAFLRLLKSNKNLKLEVFYRRGLFKGDKLLGTANVKLLPLESKCTVHDSYNLMDGRKSVGGKLEIKMRVRNPFVEKQVEETKEKWLIIDQFDRKVQPQSQGQVRQKPLNNNSGVQPNSSPAPTSSNLLQSPSFTSMEVLKYEKQQLDQQIRRYKGKLKESEEQALLNKSEMLARHVEETREVLKKGGLAALESYADAIEKTQTSYTQEAKVMSQQGNRDKAQQLLTKKKLIEREVEVIRNKLPS